MSIYTEPYSELETHYFFPLSHTSDIEDIVLFTGNKTIEFEIDSVYFRKTDDTGVETQLELLAYELLFKPTDGTLATDIISADLDREKMGNSNVEVKRNSTIDLTGAINLLEVGGLATKRARINVDINNPITYLLRKNTYYLIRSTVILGSNNCESGVSGILRITQESED